jgi:hypothetical protein
MGRSSPLGLVVAAALAAALAGAGCGKDSASPASGAHARAPASHAAAAVRGNADPESVRVISAWAAELRQGRLQAASRLFALPSRVQVSVDSQVFTLRHRNQVVAFESVLPCGAKLLRADRRGRFVNALFLLSDRADSPCDAPGASARVAFVVRGGLITEWLRAPSEPNDPGTQATPAPGAPPAPSAPPAGGPLV